MAEFELPNAACWTSETAQVVFRTEALEGDDSVFLATHTPIRDFTIDGASGGDIDSPTELGLLDALSSHARRHAFCAIQGEPGSGKSHLIRWLYINWPKGNDLPILIQRSNGSLEGAIAELKTRLGERFSHLFERIGQKQKATVKGRAAVFHSTLAALLRPDHYENPLEDQAWCKSNNPAALLLSEKALSQWQAPGRIIKLVSGEGERNSATARFGLFDIVDLVETVAEEAFGSKAAKSLLRRLDDEVGETIGPQRASGQSADDITREFSDKLPESIAFVDALNRRRNDAIQNVLGVSAEGLKALFGEVRKALAADGTRLVLLLEDITAWEGLDDSLIDVLVTNASTRDASSDNANLCDLISVIGLTPEYYKTLRANYRQRITHEIRLGDNDHGLQNVVTVRDPENRKRFVSQYLLATRAGIPRLREWREEIRGRSDRPPPNVCVDCPVRAGCFRAFGNANGVGLYPFTAEAIDGFFEALRDDDGGMTWKTPRGLIQAVLSPTLGRPEAFKQASYPGPQIERTSFSEQSGYLPAALIRFIDARVDLPDQKDRLHRLFRFWGSHGRLETTIRADGELLFYGIPRTIFETFHLPWLGDEKENIGAIKQASLPGRKPTELIADAAQSGSSKIAPEPLSSDGDVSSEVQAEKAKVEPEKRGPAVQARDSEESRRSTPRPKLRLDAEDIRSWRTGAQLKNAANWNRAAYEIIQKLDFRLLGADPWIWEKYLTPDLVKIHGTGQERASHFIIPASDWAFDGLEAYAMLIGKVEQLPPHEVEFYRAQTARMMRHLKSAVSMFLDKRLSQTPDGRRWDPATAAAANLLLRAWLRGAILPTASTSQQLATILSDEMEAESNPKARTQLWQELLDATNKRHSEMRKMLRGMLATPQGSTSGFGLAGGQAAETLVGLIRNLNFLELPSAIPEQHQSTSIVSATAEIFENARKSIPRLLSQELELLTERSKSVAATLRGRSLREHAQRVDAAITLTSEKLPAIAAERVRAWKQLYEKLNLVLMDEGQRGRIEGTIQQFAFEAEAMPAAKVELLSILIDTRAGALEQTRDAFAAAEVAVDSLMLHVGKIVADQSEAGGLAAFHQTGMRLKAAAHDSRRRLLGAEAS